jgi:hypothetical protein
LGKESEVVREVSPDVVVPGRAHDRNRRVSGIRFDPKEFVMAAEVVLSPPRPWLAAVALVVASVGVALGAVAIAFDDAGNASRDADTTDVMVRGPVAGEPCGLRIRGNLPC